MSLYEILVKKYGEEFAKKYMSRRMAAVAELTPKELEEVKAFADEHMPESDNFAVKWNGYDVLLVETPGKPELREAKPTSGANWRALAIWNGSPYDSNFVTVFAPEAEAKKLEKKGVFYIVGRLKEREYQGKKNFTFNAVAVIEVVTLDDQPTVKDIDEDFSEDEFEVEEFEVPNLEG
jgi:hypothetical protein